MHCSQFGVQTEYVSSYDPGPTILGLVDAWILDFITSTGAHAVTATVPPRVAVNMWVGMESVKYPEASSRSFIVSYLSSDMFALPHTPKAESHS
jgi:hypothetical protein